MKKKITMVLVVCLMMVGVVIAYAGYSDVTISDITGQSATVEMEYTSREYSVSNPDYMAIEDQSIGVHDVEVSVTNIAPGWSYDVDTVQKNKGTIPVIIGDVNVQVTGSQPLRKNTDVRYVICHNNTEITSGLIKFPANIGTRLKEALTGIQVNPDDIVNVNLTYILEDLDENDSQGQSYGTKIEYNWVQYQ